MTLLVSEDYINATAGHMIGNSGDAPYEPFTDDIGRLFRDMQREYGRCISGVFIHPNHGAPCSDAQCQRAVRIGWVFSKRMEYEDAHPSRRMNDYGLDKCPGEYHREHCTYVREVWVTLHDAPDDVVRTPHYHELPQ